MQKTLIALAVLALSACGGGSSGGSSLVPGKSAVGVVGGVPGALTFGGQAATISGAVTQNGASATVNDVQPGDIIDATVVETIAKAATGLTLTGVNVRFEAKGALSAVDTATGTLALFSQVIHTDALTQIDEDNSDDTYSSLTLADLVAGDFVEVSGQRQADGSILATRIERKLILPGQPGHSESELRGTVSGLDTRLKTFRIGDQTVDYSTATVEGNLADGLRVEIEGALVADVIVATKVEAEHRGHGAGIGLGEFEGAAIGLDTVAKTFSLHGFTVDYANATVTGLLGETARVEVEGSFDAVDTSLLHATRIEVKYRDGGSGLANGEVKGPASLVDVVNQTFTVGSQNFFADAQTIVELNDQSVNLDQLTEDRFVEVRFDSTHLQGDAAYVVKVELKSLPIAGGLPGSGVEGLELKGPVTSFNAGSKTFVLNAYTVQVDANTRYETGDSASTEAAFFGSNRDGSAVEVHGRLNGEVLMASKIELEGRRR